MNENDAKDANRTKLVREVILLTPEAFERVKAYRWEARLETRQDALRALVDAGLAAVGAGEMASDGATQSVTDPALSPDPRIAAWVEEQEAARANRASLDDPALDPAASHLRLVNKSAYKAFDEAYRRLSPEDRSEMDRRLKVIWERFVAAGRTSLRGVTEEEIRRIAAEPADGAKEGGE